MILLRIFKNSRSGGVAGVIVLGVAVFIGTAIRHTEIREISAMPFYNLIFGTLHLFPLLNRIIALMVVWMLCYILFRIGLDYFLLEARSYMPAYFFILTAFALPDTQQVTPVLVGSLFYLLCFAFIFGVRDQKPDTFRIFHASLLLALGSMFYLKLIWFLPLIWISLVTLRPVTWRELFYPVTAYLLLGLLLFTWYWAIQDDPGALRELLRRNLSFKGSFRVQHFSIYIYYGFILLLVLFSSSYMVTRFQARKTAIQDIYQVMFYQFIAGILFFILIARFSITSILFIAFPVTFILSNYFHRKRNPWRDELAMWIMVGLLIYVQWQNQF